MCKSEKKLNVLIHGFGSLNAGIIRKLKKSVLLNNIYIIANNNIEDIDCIYIGSPKTIKFKDLKVLIKQNNIDFVILFDEIYNSLGLTDYYINTLKIPIIGITKEWAVLENSKMTGKEFMSFHNIKTPNFAVINNTNELKDIILKFGLPIVIKNNFLQGGYGSYICKNMQSALDITRRLLKEFNYCLAEKYIAGEEISQQYFWDRNTLLPLLPVKDFKKDNDGLNTGGLGSYIPIVLDSNKQKILNNYNQHLQDVFAKTQPNFTGIFTVNLIFTDKEVFTLEFNMRPGITEFETFIEHLESDLLELFYNCATEKLENANIKYKKGITGCIALLHKNYKKEKMQKYYISLKRGITAIDNNIKINLNINKFDTNHNALISSKKHFLSVLCTDSINPFRKIYKFLDTFESKDIYYRKDIGIQNEKQAV